MESQHWVKGSLPESVYHIGCVGVNTDHPDEALTVHGNIKLSGQILHTSDIRAKQDLKEVSVRKLNITLPAWLALGLKHELSKRSLVQNYHCYTLYMNKVRIDVAWGNVFLKWPKNALKTSGWSNLYGRKFYTTQLIVSTFVVSNFDQIPDEFNPMRLDFMCLVKNKLQKLTISSVAVEHFPYNMI